MISASGRYVIALNGEIYNHLDMRTDLAGEGGSWRGRSDTESFLAALDAWGICGALERTVGMFAMAIWDKQERVLTLARDRFGEKPLYYWSRNGSVVFGSELRAIRRYPGFEATIDPLAAAAFLRYSYVPEPLAIYKGVRKVGAGSMVSFDANGERHESRFWSAEQVALSGLQNPFTGSFDDAKRELSRLLAASVKGQLMSDVALGAFLSGGIDSSLVVAIMQEVGSGPARTFSIGFEETGFDESRYAGAVARHLGTKHEQVVVSSTDALAVIPSLPTTYDEPFADSSQIPTILVSRLARSRVTVALSGDGGDELFGGYNRYRTARRLTQVPPFLRHSISRGLRTISPGRWDALNRSFGRLLPRRFRHALLGDKLHKLGHVLRAESPEMVYDRLVSIWPDGPPVTTGHSGNTIAAVFGSLNPEFAAEDRMMMGDTVTYLTGDILCKVDRAAMSNSLETRVPLLDHRIFEFAWTLPKKMKSDTNKGILRELLYERVPRHLVDRPKMGFGVPIGEWLRGPLRDWGASLLCEKDLRDHPYLDSERISRAWTEHSSGRRNWQHRLWNVLMLRAWEEQQGRQGTIE